MRLFIAASLVAIAGPAIAADQTPAQPPAPAPMVSSSAPDKQICRTEEVTGSVIPERHCHTRAQWAELNRQHEAELRSMHDERGWSNTGH